MAKRGGRDITSAFGDTAGASPVRIAGKLHRAIDEGETPVEEIAVSLLERGEQQAAQVGRQQMAAGGRGEAAPRSGAGIWGPPTAAHE